MMACEFTAAMLEAAAELEDSYGADACARAAAMAHAAVDERNGEAAVFWGGVAVLLANSKRL